MIGIFNRHKKFCIIAGITLLIVLFIIYLIAMLLPGLWHGDAFLYRQDDGSFLGSDIYAEYKMNLKPADYGTDITFSVNDKTNYYQIKYDKNDLNRNVEVLENGNVICKGKAFGQDNNYVVIDNETGSSDTISIRVGNEVPTEDELFPGYTKLYNWSVAGKNDTRGNPWILLYIALLAVTLLLDVKFPNLFWILEHRLDVEGGRPSESYRAGQKIRYFLMAIGILVCVVLTFTIH